MSASCSNTAKPAVCFSRELRRIVYVPYDGDSIPGTTPDDITALLAFKTAINAGSTSSAFGMRVALGKKFAGCTVAGWSYQ